MDCVFNPTKHAKEFNQAPLIRRGGSLPSSAIALGYYETLPIHPKNHLTIFDLSYQQYLYYQEKGSIQEVWANEQGLLLDDKGLPDIYARNVLITPYKKDDQYLFYCYELTYLVYSRDRVEDVILLVDEKKNTIQAPYVYEIVATQTRKPHVYRVRIFTNFEYQISYPIYVSYTAYDNGRLIPAYKEEIKPKQAFQKTNRLEDVKQKEYDSFLYYQSAGKKAGESRFYVSHRPMRETDYRNPVFFRYKIKVEVEKANEKKEYETPWLHDYVLHPYSITHVDKEYVQGQKRLKNKTAKEIASLFIDQSILSDKEAYITYKAITEAENVSVYTQLDGNNYVYASTTLLTGEMRIPSYYRKQHRLKNIPYMIELKQGTQTLKTYEGTVNILDSHKKIDANCPEGSYVYIVNYEYPVSAYIKNGEVYVFTDVTEVYFVPLFYIKSYQNEKIKVAYTPVEESTSPWHLRIKQGRFVKPIKKGNDIIYAHYDVAEYYHQSFDEKYRMPIQKTSETPIILGERSIQLKNRPLYLHNENVTTDIEVYVNGIKVEARQADKESGIVELNMKIEVNDEVEVIYYFENYYYEYRGFYDGANKVYWHLDLNPAYGHFITYYDEKEGRKKKVPTSFFVGKVIYLYLRPQFYTDKNGNMIVGSAQKQTLFHSFEEITQEDVVLLAKIIIHPAHKQENTTWIDLRKAGGGLKKEITIEQMKEIEPESLYYWDIGYWDGEPYSENGVCVVRVPKWILKEHGGVLSKQEVEQKVKKHMAYGVVPIIEYVELPKEIPSAPRYGEAVVKNEN